MGFRDWGLGFRGFYKGLYRGIYNEAYRGYMKGYRVLEVRVYKEVKRGIWGLRSYKLVLQRCNSKIQSKGPVQGQEC